MPLLGRKHPPTHEKQSIKEQKAKQKISIGSDWEPINLYAAGIDIGSREHWACVPAGANPTPVRKFGAFTCDLEAMADWLKTCGINSVAMEATGVY